MEYKEKFDESKCIPPLNPTPFLVLRALEGDTDLQRQYREVQSGIYAQIRKKSKH